MHAEEDIFITRHTSLQETPKKRLHVQAKQARAHAEQKRGEATSLEAESQQAEARANELEQEARRARCFPQDRAQIPGRPTVRCSCCYQDMQCRYATLYSFLSRCGVSSVDVCT